MQALNETSKGNTTEPCYNDIPSDWNGDNGGSSGGGSIGGGATSGNDYTPRGSANSTSTLWGSAGTFYYATGGGGSSGSVEVGMGCFCAPPPAPEQKSYSNKADNCPKGEMMIPINGYNGLDIRAVLEELAPETPITDLDKFLECFDTTKPALVTLYADQPVKNSSASTDIFRSDVGHAFISISQNGKISTFGFYPEKEGIKDAVIGPSQMGNNGGDHYDVSMTMSVSGSTLKKIIDKAVKFPSDYKIYNYNCTDYALELANLAGANISNAWGVYPGGGGGDNPGKLGQIMRLKNNSSGVTINKDGGSAPSKDKACN